MKRKVVRITSCLLIIAASPSQLQAEEIHEAWITEIQSSVIFYDEKSLRVKSSTKDASTKNHALDGIASFYWQDLYTASGEIFDKRAMTAAHPTLPFGTIVEVTNLGNGRSARVRINDRGPFVQGRVIDVSEAAAEALDMRNRGLAPVRLNIVTASSEAR